MADDLISIAQRSYQAYVDKDRPAIEALIGAEFHFTSPLDNRLDRAGYFARCWPNSQTISGFTFINLVASGDRVFVTYDGTSQGHGFRNTEILTIRNGQIVDAEVYFGWSLPHPAKPGEFTNG